MFLRIRTLPSRMLLRTSASGAFGCGRFLMTSDARSFAIAQRVRGHHRVHISGLEHQRSGHVASPGFQAALHGAEQCVRIGIRMGGLKFGQKFPPGSRRVLIEPHLEVVGDLYKRIGTPATSRRGRLFA